MGTLVNLKNNNFLVFDKVIFRLNHRLLKSSCCQSCWMIVFSKIDFIFSLSYVFSNTLTTYPFSENENESIKHLVADEWCQPEVEKQSLPTSDLIINIILIEMEAKLLYKIHKKTKKTTIGRTSYFHFVINTPQVIQVSSVLRNHYHHYLDAK